MNDELTNYVIAHYRSLMTDVEQAANRHLTTTYKFTEGQSDLAAQEKTRAEGSVRRRWLSDDPEVLALAADGLEAFRAKAAARILAEHADQVVLNRCPQCTGLTRTPLAQMCPHCGHSWHGAAAH
jgi:hypothetical protein